VFAGFDVTGQALLKLGFGFDLENEVIQMSTRAGLLNFECASELRHSARVFRWNAGSGQRLGDLLFETPVRWALHSGVRPSWQPCVHMQNLAIKIPFKVAGKPISATLRFYPRREVLCTA
jgi:hypothetical protein